MWNWTRRSFIVIFVIGIINCSVFIVMTSFFGSGIPVVRKWVTNAAHNFTNLSESESETDISASSFFVNYAAVFPSPSWTNVSLADIPQRSRNETGVSFVRPNATFQNVRGALKGSMSLRDLYNNIDRNWSFNATEADNLRSVLERSCNTSKLFLVTQENIHPYEKVRYDSDWKAKFVVTGRAYRRFIKKMPYQQKSLKKCSLVGNSGILLGSKCGKAIDNADYIFRFNTARVRGYSEDVGSKTSLVTCNLSILNFKFDRIHTRAMRRFRKYMTEEYHNASILMPAFAYRFTTLPAFKTQDLLRPTMLKVVYPHPYFQTLVRRFWKTKKNLRAQKMSTGIILFTAAMSFCEEVHLYGYWPFPEDPDGNPLYYHYFDKNAVMLPPKKLKTLHHNMPAEFKMYMDLHNKGAIKLHVGQCDV